MSSPIANRKPSLIQKKLVALHQRTTHSSRISSLSEEIGKTIASLFPPATTSIRALDIGCGDMTLAENIAATNRALEWTCADIYELPEHFIMSEKWKKYRQFNGFTLPFEDTSFDVVMLSDVLHHCLPRSVALLQEAGRVGRYVIVKDHYEYGLYSRQMLRLMDFVGNYGYGVEIPDHYFTPASFAETCKDAKLNINKISNNIDIYSKFPFLRILIKKSWHFIAVLNK